MGMVAASDPDLPPEGEGYALEALPAEPHRLPPAPRPVATDAVCLVCGYSLRGLTVGGHCPECGTPIGRSLGGNQLRYSNPEYLASLHRGVLVILGAVAAQFIVAVVALLAALAFLFLLSAPGSPNVYRPLDLAVVYLEAVLSLVVLYGWWVFTSPDPALDAVDRGLTVQRVARAAVAVRAASTMFTAAWHTALNPVGGALPLSPGVMTVTLVDGATLAFMFIASMLYVQRVAGRLPDEHVARRARLLMWLGPVLYVFGCGIGTLVALLLYWDMLNRVRLDISRIREAA